MVVFILGFSAFRDFSLYSALIKADGTFIVSVSPVAACYEYVFALVSGIDIVVKLEPFLGEPVMLKLQSICNIIICKGYVLSLAYSSSERCSELI